MIRVNLRAVILSLLFTTLGCILVPSQSLALEGFRNIFVFADTRHFEFGVETRLEFFVNLTLENDDPAPPAGIETLDVTGPDGRIHDLLNSEANRSAVFIPPAGFFFLADYDDSNSDGIEDFPTGDYVFRLVTTAGQTFTTTKALTTIAPCRWSTR